MKDSILIYAKNSSSWIGGLYYMKNMLFQLMSNDRISSKYDFCVYTYKENYDLFRDLPKQVKFIEATEKEGRIADIKLLLACKLNKAKYIYPYSRHIVTLVGTQPISWIADFQHNHLTNLFTEEELEGRSRGFKLIADSDIPLVLSSNDCFSDFEEFYSSTKENVSVVPFVSFIENDIRKITPEIEKSVLEKFNLCESKYIYIANQFWQHKNHIIVLEAMKELANKGELNYKFVFTGNLNDYRAPEYIDSLKALFDDPSIKDFAINLGFVDRLEQLVVMKNAEYLIQPSLFEGWGTVVEDGKVLDKTILLSDIPVHREQKSDKCVLFNPYDAKELTALIIEENSKAHIDSVEGGIKDMHIRALEYSKNFENILDL